MSPYQYVFVLLLFTLSSVFNDNMYLTEALNGGFSVELIHRDSPKSPFYNSSETQIERMTNAIHRSFERVKHFYPEDVASDKKIQPPITSINGEYVMKFSIGTPKHDVLAIADLGSDLIWIQCQPCQNCYRQIDPIFDPSKSKTYKDVSCASSACNLVKRSDCKKFAFSFKCKYEENYMDGSGSSGDVAQETFTFDTNIKNAPAEINNIVFGCSHDTKGRFDPKATGMLGLGSGPASLLSQLGVEKFSYCFSEDHNSPSLFNFGEKAVVSGPGTVSTPLEIDKSSPNYFLILKSISVAGKRIDFPQNDGKAGSRMKLDTGSTFTFIPLNVYTKLASLVAARISLNRVSEKIAFRIGHRLCYKYSPSTFTAPPITIHFDGADVVLDQYNTFGLIGNMAQANFLIGIDMKKKVVSFKRTICSSLKL
ncbi:unnamed protein product [Lupinus luteus]|uniref:Peptidase A1 domain-containing protein n=1 Tax=Lupinus luteus TaxID=3873 RepID=A0AAV1VZB8_LUPLU